MNTCTMLNVTGDVTIAWTDENSKEVKEWIESKLKEGCTFFIVEKKMKFIPVKKTITDVSSLPKEGEVRLSDKDASKAFSQSEMKVDKKNKFMFKASKPKKRNLMLGDKGAEELVHSGKAQTVVSMENYKQKNKVIKASTDPDEIMRSNTVCSRRMAGG